MTTSSLDRAQGCLLGQFIGDSLGSLVEFQSPDEIAAEYPQGVRDLAAGGTWNTLPGQPTDDSEMAILLARLLAENGSYDADLARERYVFWLNSHPFDVGNTIRSALSGWPTPESQANGALMRVSPIGIFGARFDNSLTATMARADAAITHPNPICVEINALFTMAIAEAIRRPVAPREVYDMIRAWSAEMDCRTEVREWIAAAATSLPPSFLHQQGWVKLAFCNALYRLARAEPFEEALIATVGLGGDTDTNAAIAGSLLGAVYGRDAIPKRWIEPVLVCRPERGRPGVHKPRPEVFWPVDVLELAATLLG